MDGLEEFARRRLTLFPGYPAEPDGSELTFVHARSPHGFFEVHGPLHTSFTAEWPIRVDVPASLRGFRHALGLSQLRFAALIETSRVNIERWEGGTIRPFRGDVLSLLSLLRPHVDGPLAVGQLLNLAAAAVCPVMTRPAAIYTGHDLAVPLAHKRHDHTDLLPSLLIAFRAVEVLVPLDEPHYEQELSSRYLPVVGTNSARVQEHSWEPAVSAVAQQLTEKDRRLWLAMGRRLGELTSAGHDIRSASMDVAGTTRGPRDVRQDAVG